MQGQRDLAYLRLRALIRQLAPNDCVVEHLDVGRYFGMRIRGLECVKLFFGQDGLFKSSERCHRSLGKRLGPSGTHNDQEHRRYHSQCAY